MAGHWICVSMAIICLCAGVVEGKPNRIQPSIPDTLAVGNCKKYHREGKGDFSLEKKYYFPHGAGFYIAAIEMEKRLSFYTCDPHEVKYGIDADGKRWWVDKGCEAVFEIVECPETGNTLDLNAPMFRSQLLKRTGLSSASGQPRINTEARFKNVEYVVV